MPFIRSLKEKQIRWYKNKKILTYIIGLFIVSIMILSVLNIGKNDTDNTESYTYNGFKFIKVSNGWLTYVDNKQLILAYGPRELEDIYLPPLTLTLKEVKIVMRYRL